MFSGAVQVYVARVEVAEGCAWFPARCGWELPARSAGAQLGLQLAGAVVHAVALSPHLLDELRR